MRTRWWQLLHGCYSQSNARACVVVAVSIAGNRLPREATKQLAQLIRRPGSFDALTAVTLGATPLPVMQLLGYSTAEAVAVEPPGGEASRRSLVHADVTFTTDAVVANPRLTDLSIAHSDIGDLGARVVAELVGHSAYPCMVVPFLAWRGVLTSLRGCRHHAVFSGSCERRLDSLCGDCVRVGVDAHAQLAHPRSVTEPPHKHRVPQPV